MQINQPTFRIALLLSLIVIVTLLSTRMRADTGSCNGATTSLPFTDVMASPFFCQIAAAYFSGLTNGTTATTYSPANTVTREQMAAFTTRTLDQSLKRGNQRAALGEWWTNQTPFSRVGTLTGINPQYLACDGQTVWVSNTQSNSVSRIDIKTGDSICNLTGITFPQRIVIVNGFVYVTSFQSPGKIHRSSIGQTSDSVIPEAYTVGANPVGITYDGKSLWTANAGTGPGSGSISRVNLAGTETTFTAGFSQPRGILFDGVNLWVTDSGDTSLKRVDTTTGAVILPTIPLSGSVNHPVFDGTNLWIPCGALAQLGVPDKVFVVRAVGAPPLFQSVLAELTGNGLNGAFQTAFDGERICVTNASARSVSLWKATGLSPITSIDILSPPQYYSRGVCSDGTTFFVGLRQDGGTGRIARF